MTVFCPVRATRACFKGSAIDTRALNAGAVPGIRPVAEVEREAWLLGPEEVIAGEGTMGVEELVGDEGGTEAPRGERLEEPGRNLLMSA
jgi:hypothetical protein